MPSGRALHIEELLPRPSMMQKGPAPFLSAFVSVHIENIARTSNGLVVQDRWPTKRHEFESHASFFWVRPPHGTGPGQEAMFLNAADHWEVLQIKVSQWESSEDVVRSALGEQQLQLLLNIRRLSTKFFHEGKKNAIPN